MKAGDEGLGSGDTGECNEQEMADLYTTCVVKSLLPKLQSIYNDAVAEHRHVDGVHECRWIDNSFEYPQNEDIKSALDC